MISDVVVAETRLMSLSTSAKSCPPEGDGEIDSETEELGDTDALIEALFDDDGETDEEGDCESETEALSDEEGETEAEIDALIDDDGETEALSDLLMLGLIEAEIEGEMDAESGILAVVL